MHSSHWESSSRLIPTRYETDLWRTSPRWEMTPMAPLAPLSSTPPFPTSFPPPPPPDFSSSLVHYPSRERQQADFEREMRRMNDEMTKMMDNMKRNAPAPLDSVDDWRLTENFRMENPVQNFADGSRKFHLQFDMRQFKPEEIQVRTAGNTLTVSAKHDEKDPNKSVFREYNRSYVLPKDVSPERLTSKLSTGGVLTIEAPLPALEGPREKLIPIKHN
ncbi:small heat shock protein (HSP20) [Mactra antiquata]